MSLEASSSDEKWYGIHLDHDRTWEDAVLIVDGYLEENGQPAPVLRAWLAAYGCGFVSRVTGTPVLVVSVIDRIRFRLLKSLIDPRRPDDDSVLRSSSLCDIPSDAVGRCITDTIRLIAKEGRMMPLKAAPT